MNQSQIFSSLDTCLSSMIGKLGLVKTLEILNNVDNGLIHFLPREPKNTVDKIQDFVLFRLANYVEMSENELVSSRSHYHSQIKAVGFLILSEFDLSVSQISHVFKRRNDFVSSKIENTKFLLSSKHANPELKSLYERIIKQLEIYRSIAE